MQAIKICSIFGIPIKIDISLTILIAYILILFSGGIHLATLWFDLFFVFGFIVMLLLSILFHELSHSLVARLFGCRIHEITLEVLGGVALLEEFPKKPWQAFLVAAAGPLFSVVFAFLLSFCGAQILNLHDTPTLIYILGQVFIWSSMTNFGLAIFNCIPAFPLDGGRMLANLLQCFSIKKVRATMIAVFLGRGIAILWIALWLLNFLFHVRLDFSQARPEWLREVLIIFFGNSGFLLPLVAYMIWVSGIRELRYVLYCETYKCGDRK